MNVMFVDELLAVGIKLSSWSSLKSEMTTTHPSHVVIDMLVILYHTRLYYTVYYSTVQYSIV